MLLLVAAMVAAVVAGAVWRFAGAVPDPLAAAATAAGRLPGVVAVDLARNDYPESATRGFGPTPARFDVTVRLAATLTPEDAAATAEGVRALFVPAAEEVIAEAVSVVLRVTAGEPDLVFGSARYPLEVPYTAALAADVADAFTIWQAGARRLQTYGGGAVVPDPPVPAAGPAGIGIEATDPVELVQLASRVTELGRAADLHSSDARVRYESYGSVPDVEAVRLAVAAASRPGVKSAVFSDSTSPTLFVYTVGPADSAPARRLRSWLEAPEHTAAVGRPTAFVISEPGYANLIEGWVSAVGPPEPAPHSLPLPGHVEAWPEDRSAPGCTGADLELRYGGSDAATGARYAWVIARNVSAGPCAVEGIPEVVFRSGHGTAQADIRLEPYAPGVIAERLVVPSGEEMVAPLRWRAMSTANDPDVTTAIDVVAVPGAAPVSLDVTEDGASASGLDILDGAEVRIGPWVQAVTG